MFGSGGPSGQSLFILPNRSSGEPSYGLAFFLCP
jgi:hypothetical protein